MQQKLLLLAHTGIQTYYKDIQSNVQHFMLGKKKITIKHADYSMETPWKQKLNKFLEEIQQN